MAVHREYIEYEFYCSKKNTFRKTSTAACWNTAIVNYSAYEFGTFTVLNKIDFSKIKTIFRLFFLLF